MNYEQFLANAECALNDCREMKETLSAVQAALSAVPDMVRKNERLEKENAELKGELEILQCIQWPTGYMELPLDADGVPIRIGETLFIEIDGDVFSGKVNEMVFSGEDGWAITLDNTDGFAPKSFNHKPPDSWEKLEEDAQKTACAYAHAPIDNKGFTTCEGCRFRNNECNHAMTLDVLKRAKKLAGVEEEAER